MTVLARSGLYYAADYQLVASGVFQFPDATYSVSFGTEAGLLRCLDVMLSMPVKAATPRLVLRPQGYQDERPEWPVSGVRFDFDLHHQDSWDPENKPLPPASFVTIAQLRDLLCQWAFGDVLPPPAVRWTEVPHESVGW